MDAQNNLPSVPRNVKFRVLIIGRANAGKTTILLRVCATTESPKIYSVDSSGTRSLVQQLDASMERGEHNIEHELSFTSHGGYVFHDSRGFESGNQTELEIVQDFVRRKSRARDLRDRLHAIWYCIPMDNARPELELKYFEHICPDKNVPVIAVFTKYEQLRLNIMMMLEDQHRDPALLNTEMEKVFNEYYLVHLKGSPFACLERMHKHGQRCTPLLEKTADALSGSVVALMFLSVQKDNLELNINRALKWAHASFERGSGSIESVIKICISSFPSIWYWFSQEDDHHFFMFGLDRWEGLSYGELDRRAFKALSSQLCSFLANPPLSESSDNAYHILIALILILEYVCRCYALRPQEEKIEAVEKAYVRYRSSETHNAVTKQFPASTQYSILEFTEFILEHRLS